MKLVTTLFLLVTVLGLQSCATNPSNAEGAVADPAYSSAPSMQNTDYIYRSPPAAALQSHGLVR